MGLDQLDGSTFDAKIFDEGGKCLVMFSRKNCHVCKEVTPMLEDLSPEYAGRCGFYYVDVEDDPVLYKRFPLKGVPSLLFFNQGEFQGRLAGKVEEDAVREKIETL
ncbi:MAG: thioredoxin family protein [Gracilibacteraceae bacterium]|nr:thioredoxin family protein [Gracilibacteraceae bacterium]